MLDGINRRYGAGVTHKSMPVGDLEITVIEGTGRDDYSKLSTSEQVAWMTFGNWFVLCSNAEILMRY